MNESNIETVKLLATVENDKFDRNIIVDIASNFIKNGLFKEFGEILKVLGLEKFRILTKDERFLRALMSYYLEKKLYKEVEEILKFGNFTDLSGLVDVWDNVHYAMKEEETQAPLSPVVRFRLRQKFPPPRNINPSGERPSAMFGEHARSILKSWMVKHHQNPYPPNDERADLAVKCGLTCRQVKTWFSNARRRQKRERERLQDIQNNDLLYGNSKLLVSEDIIQQTGMSLVPETFSVGVSIGTEVQNAQETTLGKLRHRNRRVKPRKPRITGESQIPTSVGDILGITRFFPTNDTQTVSSSCSGRTLENSYHSLHLENLDKMCRNFNYTHEFMSKSILQTPTSIPTRSAINLSLPDFGNHNLSSDTFNMRPASIPHITYHVDPLEAMTTQLQACTVPLTHRFLPTKYYQLYPTNELPVVASTSLTFTNEYYQGLFYPRNPQSYEQPKAAPTPTANQPIISFSQASSDSFGLDDDFGWKDKPLTLELFGQSELSCKEDDHIKWVSYHARKFDAGTKVRDDDSENPTVADENDIARVLLDFSCHSVQSSEDSEETPV